MNDNFAARRSAARKRLDAMDPHMAPAGMATDPLRREWFEAVYELAEGDPACVPWAAMQPHSLLSEWLSRNDLHGMRALDVGCGLGDNAEALAKSGALTTAFDLSEKAIEWVRQRFPGSPVNYQAADLFDPPDNWTGAFDFVHECYTLQALPPFLLDEAARRLAHFIAPGGHLLVISRARSEATPPKTPPWLLGSAEIETIAGATLKLVDAERIAPEGAPANWRALYRKVG